MQRLLAGLVFMMLGTSAALADDDPAGVWIMSDGKVTVKVANCGSNLCGKIIALKKPLDKHGKPKLDKENPDPSLRARPVIGISLLDGMKPSGEREWEGAIYNPDDGRTYSARMKIDGDRMKVDGCVVIFCKTKMFTRAE